MKKKLTQFIISDLKNFNRKYPAIFRIFCTIFLYHLISISGFSEGNEDNFSFPSGKTVTTKGPGKDELFQGRKNTTREAADKADPEITNAKLADVIIVRDPAASELEKLAVKELVHYISALTGVDPEVSNTGKIPSGRPSIIVASSEKPAARTFIKKIKGGLPDLGEEGFMIRTMETTPPVTLITGNSPVSVVYGAYELLEEYGIRFYVSDEVVPETDPSLRLKKFNIVSKPEMAVRGTLPWYNFLMGPTSWRLEDYKTYIDQLLKMKYNMVGFHFYTVDLFFHFTYKGIRSPKEELNHRHPASYPTSKISLGKEHFTGEGEFFGSPGHTSVDINVKVLQEALAYAKSRGFKTAVGFELDQIPPEMIEQMPDSVLIGNRNLDPTSKEADAFLSARLKSLIEIYSDVDYYWLWYTEHRLWDNVKDEELSESFRKFYKENMHHFGYDMSHVTSKGGVAYLCWLKKAHALLEELKPGARILTGGWTIDAMLPGLDKALPRDIALSSLSAYEPEWSLQNLLFDRFWKGIDRPRIVTSWFEFDGRCLGQTQPKTRIYGPLLRKVNEAGIDGMIMLHWRTRILDMNFSYFAEKSWGNPMDSYEFYVDYASTRYGAEVMEEARRAHTLLENYEEMILANRTSHLCWIGIDFGFFPQIFADMVNDIQVSSSPAHDSADGLLIEQEEKTHKSVPDSSMKLVITEDKFAGNYASLIDSNNPLSIPCASAILKNARFWFASALNKASGEGNKERLRYMISRVDFYLLWLEMHQSLIVAWTEYRKAINTGEKEAMKKGVSLSIELARKAPVEETINKYSEFITNRGEQGVLVSLNRKVWDRYLLILSNLEQVRAALTSEAY